MTESMAVRIRAINPQSSAEVELVAVRMRQTLVEVLGEEVGGNMYTMDWLVQRVFWHLDPSQCVGQVFLAEDDDGHIIGHTIVRIERDGTDGVVGLFSTFFVEPGSRNRSTATSLVAHGERWMMDHGMRTARTYTAETNATGLAQGWADLKKDSSGARCRIELRMMHPMVRANFRRRPDRVSGAPSCREESGLRGRHPESSLPREGEPELRPMRIPPSALREPES